MRNRKFTFLLCMALTAAVALFGVTEAKAFEGSLVVPVDNCTMETLTGTAQPINVIVTRENDTTWNYIFDGISNKANQILTLVPVCDPELVYGGDPLPTILSPGVGDPTTDFGFGDFQFLVTRTTPILNGSEGELTLTTNRPTGNRATSLQIKSGKDLYYCKNVSGPACPDVSLTSRLHSTCENVLTGFDNTTRAPVPLDNTFSILTTVNDLNCEITVTVYDDLNCAGSPETDVLASDLSLNLSGTLFEALECGSENQRCPICELIGHHNPCSYTKYSAGRPYTVCYDCNTGERVSCN